MSKKRSKFVPIGNVTKSNSFVMPGRQKCECAATKHELINNCTNCGRIICAQEGAGPCWFCGDLVCTNEDFQYFSTKSNKSQNSLKKLMNNNWAHHDKEENFEEISVKDNLELSENDVKMAIERKQRLLEFDRTSARRTKVIDDQKDYYETEGKLWIDPKTRMILKNKNKELREERFTPKYKQESKYTLDLKTGKMILEESTNRAAYELFEEPEIDFENLQNYEVPRERNNIQTDFLSFVQPNKKFISVVEKTQPTNLKTMCRIQDKGLQEIRDEGMCLSMHQPWASLLVMGIKKHEGRSWFTNHRGRLWIAATSKAPSDESINECKQFYMSIGVKSNLFPDNYPVGCILGCVDIVDCLPEEDYLEQYSDASESGSAFVFICENPRELNLKFPIKGKHKIYKLDAQVHKAAKAII